MILLFERKFPPPHQAEQPFGAISYSLSGHLAAFFIGKIRVITPSRPASSPQHSGPNSRRPSLSSVSRTARTPTRKAEGNHFAGSIGVTSIFRNSIGTPSDWSPTLPAKLSVSVTTFCTTPFTLKTR